MLPESLDANGGSPRRYLAARRVMPLPDRVPPKPTVGAFCWFVRRRARAAKSASFVKHRRLERFQRVERAPPSVGATPRSQLRMTLSLRPACHPSATCGEITAIRLLPVDFAFSPARPGDRWLLSGPEALAPDRISKKRQRRSTAP